MENAGSLLVLSLEDVVSCGGADMPRAIDDLRAAFKLWSEGRINLPHKTTLKAVGARHEHEAGLINFLPAYLDTGGAEVFSCKAMGAMPSNLEIGLPRATGLILLFDSRTKAPQCMMDAQVISATRTGAVTALAAEKLADHAATEAGLVGAGVNMRTQLLGLKAALPGLKRARVFSRGQSKHAFAKDMTVRTGMEVVPVDSCEEALRGCLIVVTCLPNASAPVVKADWLRPGGLTLFNIGAYEMELPALRGMDRIVCDLWAHAKHRGQQTHARAVEAGVIEEGRIEELPPILAGAAPGRRASRERIYFSPVGLGFEDALIAWRVYQEALHRGAGARLPLWTSADWI